MYLPAGYAKSKQWPVILSLHGADERGEDGLAQTQVGIGGAIRFHADRFPSVVVMPQCRKVVWWTDPEMEAMGGYGTFAFAYTAIKAEGGAKCVTPSILA